MGEEIEQIKKQLIDNFPLLLNDLHFETTSNENINYNCIAWAFRFYEDRWMWFDTRPRLDGVWYWWPKGVTVSQDISAYIEAFKTTGFEVCETYDLEYGFIKIALYTELGTSNCSHASRQRQSGLWTSKLGRSHDIQHGTPYTIEGDIYGNVACFMKMKK
jgi:hypothetical protein